MMYSCDDFLEAAGIKEEFYGLCANAGLTRLALCRVVQYKKLTSCFINSFRYNHDAGVIEFKIYNNLMTMYLARFCDIIGVPNAGQTARMNSQPSELRTLFDSLCIQGTRISGVQRFPASYSPTSDILRILLLEGCWLVTTRATVLHQIFLSMRTPSLGRMIIMWVH